MNTDAFKALLTKEYESRFANDPEYAFSARTTTPEVLAERMTRGLTTGGANKDSAAVKAVCKALGIKHTYSAIKTFLGGEL